VVAEEEAEGVTTLTVETEVEMIRGVDPRTFPGRKATPSMDLLRSPQLCTDWQTTTAHVMIGLKNTFADLCAEGVISLSSWRKVLQRRP
jgi:hypothetical protein